MFQRKPLSELQEELRVIDDEIAAHPLSEPRVKRAHEIIDNKGDKENTEVEADLAAEGLPSLAELGALQARNTVSWWRLHRARGKLVKKIEKLTR
ncbi:MAG: hypothetical protein Q4G21_10390 [Dermabacter sp.]|nr:hypothetical protein [Dermabacter sp.]